MAIGAFLALSAAGGLAQSTGMTRAEAMALYAAGGFPISADGKSPTNTCGKPANPKISFLDINSDKRRDALFTDSGACYGPDQRWFSLAVKEADGRWRSVGGFAGTAQAVGVASSGWFTLSWTSGGKTQTLGYNGQRYVVGGSMAAGAKVAPPAPPAAAATAAQSGAGRDAAILRAAGFTQKKSGWESANCEAPHELSYEPGKIDQVKDLNSDGRPEAIVTEGGGMCYGNTGQAFWIVSQQANGSWKLVFNSVGIAEFLPTKGVGGWPDISVGGPGFCFPVMRWNGSAYVLNRRAYEGKACR
jgi:hypothetical protein